MDEHLSWKEEDFQNYLRLKESSIAGQVNEISERFKDHNLVSVDKIDQIMSKVKVLQDKSSYNNDYSAWVKKHLPVRLEELLGIEHLLS